MKFGGLQIRKLRNFHFLRMWMWMWMYVRKSVSRKIFMYFSTDQPGLVLILSCYKWHLFLWESYLQESLGSKSPLPPKKLNFLKIMWRLTFDTHKKLQQIFRFPGLGGLPYEGWHCTFLSFCKWEWLNDEWLKYMYIYWKWVLKMWFPGVEGPKFKTLDPLNQLFHSSATRTRINAVLRHWYLPLGWLHNDDYYWLVCLPVWLNFMCLFLVPCLWWQGPINSGVSVSPSVRA